MTDAIERTDASALADALAEASEAYERRREQVEEIGERDLEALAEAHDRATTLLDRYEGRATGTGDFEAFVTFQSEFAEHAESLPADLPRRAAFERAAETLDKRRLSVADFERARETLSAASDATARLDERREAREHYRTVRRTVLRRRNELNDRIDELEEAKRHERVDLDAPIEELRAPIAAYDERVRDAFETFRREASARAVLTFVASTEAYPLVPFPQPPADLYQYVEGREAGTEPIPRLLEYSEYSTSKLEHYVAEPRELRRHVATHRTYLTNLHAAPLEIGWPPPPADRLWWRARELVSSIARFAPSDVIAKLRAVRALARDEERYEHLREAALAREALDAETRERLASGEVEREVAEVRAERDRLDEVLSTYPAV